MFEEFRNNENGRTEGQTTQGTHAPAASNHVKAVLRALENPKYDWRTVGGVARETEIPEEQVEEILTECRHLLVRTTDETGRSVYTTRHYYDTHHSFARRLLSAIADTIK